MRFRFRAINASNQRRNGVIEALDREDATALLRSEGMRLLELSETKSASRWRLELKREFTFLDVAEFSEELGNLLAAGAPLRTALSIQAQGNGAAARLAQFGANGIDAGKQLSESLKDQGAAADLLVEYIKAGEDGAGLEALLLQASRFLRARADSLASLSKALAYPAFIVALAMIGLGVITLVVAPALSPLLATTEDARFLKALAEIGIWVQNNNSTVYLGAACGIGLVFLATKRPIVRRSFSKIVWSAPISGALVRDLSIGESFEVLEKLLTSGRSLDRALVITAQISRLELRHILHSIANDIRDGVVVSDAFAGQSQLPKDVRRLALIGEQTSALAEAFGHAGKLCHRRAVARIDSITKVLGPAFVIGMGVFTAFMLLSVLGALGSLGGDTL